MGKLFRLGVIASLLLSLAACSEKDPIDNNDDDLEDQYLVMFYGVGGGDLDKGITQNIMQSLSVGSSDKIKLTYQYRFSSKFQKAETIPEGYKNILRFTADDNTQLRGNDWADGSTLGDAILKLKVKSFGDENYIMASDTALASFIQWSRNLYPDASRTVLIINDHGCGWNLLEDGVRDYSASQNTTTKAILQDENTTSKIGSLDITSIMSLGEVKRAISSSACINGKVDVLYDDACLMSTWENLAGYAEIADYFIGSLESAPGLGGNYVYLLDRLNGSDSTDGGLYEAMSGYVDDVIDNWWEAENEKIKAGTSTYSSLIYGDLAVYDLKKISTPESVLSEAVKALAGKYSSSETIPGISNEYVNKWSKAIDYAISSCEVATNHMSGYTYFSDIPESMVLFFASLGLKDIFEMDNSGNYICPNKYILYALHMMDIQVIQTDSDPMKYYNLWNAIANKSTDSYSAADFLTSLSNYLIVNGSTDTTFKDLAGRYINALKEFGHIRCTLPTATTTYDCEYQLCSPGLFIFPLNEEGYNDLTNFTARYQRLLPDVENALTCYQMTDFDKEVHWSDFLKVIKSAPSVVSNPIRQELK